MNLPLIKKLRLEKAELGYTKFKYFKLNLTLSLPCQLYLTHFLQFKCYVSASHEESCSSKEQVLSCTATHLDIFVVIMLLFNKIVQECNVLFVDYINFYKLLCFLYFTKLRSLTRGNAKYLTEWYMYLREIKYKVKKIKEIKKMSLSLAFSKDLQNRYC